MQSRTLLSPSNLSGKDGHRAQVVVSQKNKRVRQEKAFRFTEMEKDCKERLGFSREQDFPETLFGIVPEFQLNSNKHFSSTYYVPNTMSL